MARFWPVAPVFDVAGAAAIVVALARAHSRSRARVALVPAAGEFRFAVSANSCVSRRGALVATGFLLVPCAWRVVRSGREKGSVLRACQLLSKPETQPSLRGLSAFVLPPGTPSVALAGAVDRSLLRWCRAGRSLTQACLVHGREVATHGYTAFARLEGAFVRPRSPFALLTGLVPPQVVESWFRGLDGARVLRELLLLEGRGSRSTRIRRVWPQVEVSGGCSSRRARPSVSGCSILHMLTCLFRFF